MSIDMAQFHQVFFEESFEGLQVMETGLMELEPGNPDSETINGVFRAAHSIKGGSATFGFQDISEFTHLLETLLDEMRAGKRDIDENNAGVLLKSVDCLREMMQAAQDETSVDQQRVDQFRRLLEAELAGEAQGGAAAAAEPLAPAPASSGWNIRFHPHAGLFRNGNDPLRILRELAALGELDVHVDRSALPDFDQLDCSSCYLSWQLRLVGSASREQVLELFAWSEDDCELEITPLTGNGAGQLSVSEMQALVPQRRSSDRTPGNSVDRRQSDRRHGQGGAASIRVDTAKIDMLINLVSELVITQSMLGLLGDNIEQQQTISHRQIEKLSAGLMQLERNTRELQENVMQVRMMPISFAFSRFPRLVRDLSLELGKSAEIVISGETTEVDKNIIEKIGDPLVHLLRNSLDHGIETPSQRSGAGKSESGRIELNAYHRGGNIVIEIIDDGKGLERQLILDKAIERGLAAADENLSDRQVFDFIFAAGFSTAGQVTDVSGRGVGMDVVRRNIQELGGSIEIGSEPGLGTAITIRLPLTLAILDGQTINVGGETYIIPITSIVESLQIRPQMLNLVAGRGETFRLRDDYIPVIRLHELFGTKPADSGGGGLLVVVESDGQHTGLLIDELLGQQQVVIKSLEDHYKRMEGFSGATILGDGQVALILDMPGIVRLNRCQRPASDDAAAA